MLKYAEIRRQVAQRLRELFPRARGWEETPDAKVGFQPVDLLVKFRLGEHEQIMAVDVVSLGQPRQIRATVTKMSEIRKAKSTAQLPMRAEVARAVVRDSGERLDLLGEVEDDVADAGRVARFEKVADGAFSVEVEFASGG